MDNFNDQEPLRNAGKVKEKSMYMLQLDTPRVLILSAIVIGIITVSFLIGMNYTGKSAKEGDVFAQHDAVFPSGGIPDAPSASDPLAENKAVPSIDEQGAAAPQTDSLTAKNSEIPVPTVPVSANPAAEKVQLATQGANDEGIVPAGAPVKPSKKMVPDAHKKNRKKS